MRKVLVGFGLAAMAALALGACGGGGDKLGEDLVKGVTGGSVDVNLDDNGNGTINIGGEGGGSVSIGGGEMPEDLKDFPLPDDNKVLSSYTGSSGSGGGSVVTIAANGNYDEVSADMQSSLETAGSTISGTYTAEANGVGQSTFTFEGDSGTGTVSIAEDSSTEGFNLLISIITDTSSSTTAG